MYKAIILGIKGLELTEDERKLFESAKPLGFILFSRNIQTPAQVKALVESLRATVGNPTAPILIDQEGGRVARLKAPNWYTPLPAAVFGKIAQHDLKDAEEACAINWRLISLDLASLGINVDCAPVADLPIKGAHNVIGDRAFSSDKKIVTALSQVVVDTLNAHGIAPIIKHIPGHGRALADSHHELPVVEASYETLKESDFYAFKNVKDVKWAMTAHVVYSSIDNENPATKSAKVINEIRSTIGFNGILISDCITMKALGGSVKEKIDKSLEAGCDLIIYSHYDTIEDLEEIMKYVPELNQKQMGLVESSCTFPKVDLNFDVYDAKEKLNTMLTKYNIVISESATFFDPTNDAI